MPHHASRKAALHTAVRTTLAYFDLFDRPLTVQELRRYLYRLPAEHARPSVAELLEVLEDVEFGGSAGFWFLAGREAVVPERQRRHRLAERKIRRAIAFARAARFLPTVRMIAVCNRLAYEHSTERGDIDLFLVTRSGTLWITRFVLAAVLAVLDLRPREGKEADMFCLSFNVSEDALDVGPLFIHQDDIDLTYWAATLLPVYDPYGVHERFIRANPRVFGAVPGAASPRIPVRRTVPAPRRWTALALPLLRRLEGWSRRFQAARFPRAIRDRANTDTCVVIGPDILKFHVTDRREQYARVHRERMETFRSPVRA